MEAIPLINILISLVGLWVLWTRLRFKNQGQDPRQKDYPLVSIIIPCRNEEKRLPATLQTLLEINYSNKEIIIVNDHSEDRTNEVASQYPVRLLQAPLREEQWSGKNGACWAGAEVARGDYFLFTDADTFHQKESLQKVIDFLIYHDADLVSAPPFHLCRDYFEKLLGLFWTLPLIASAFQNSPTPQRLFAIGQYLLFKKSSYFSCGGHQAIASELVDDVSLARQVIKHQMKLKVYPTADLYSVQMYDGFFDFTKGWIRLIRLGLGKGSMQAFLEVASVCHLFAAALFDPHPILILLFLAGVLILMKIQSFYAEVRGWTAIFAPLSVLMFTVLTIIAMVQGTLRQSVVWRGRKY